MSAVNTVLVVYCAKGALKTPFPVLPASDYDCKILEAMTKRTCEAGKLNRVNDAVS